MRIIIFLLLFSVVSCAWKKENNEHIIEVKELQQVEWRAGEEVALKDVATFKESVFYPISIPEDVFARMRGLSFPVGQDRVKIIDLRYIRMLHYTLDGRILKGEMVVSSAIADDVADIFRELFEAGYPIERIQLIDDFGAQDEESMRHNNSSGFCYRVIAGSTRLSKHALGRAIDINPLYNPYFHVVHNEKGDSIGYRSLQPATAAGYVRRSDSFPYKLDKDDIAVRLFKARGFTWGGDWNDPKDYQHFEK